MNVLENIETFVVLLIDMQYGFLGYSEDRKIIPRQIELLKLCRQTNTPVVVIEYIGVQLGKTVCPLLDIAQKIPAYRYIQKSEDSAFSNPELDITLKEFGAEKLLVAGVRADTCIFKTTKDAVLKNYKVVLSDDFISGYKPCLEKSVKDWYRANTLYYECT